MSVPSSDDSVPLAPRTTSADDFEQNPLASVHSRLQAAELTPEQLLALPEDDRVREAVRRVIQDGLPISTVAKALHLSASSIRDWKSRYASFLQESTFGETNPDAAAEDAVIDPASQSRFADNWQQLLEKSRAQKQDFKQDGLEIFLLTNAWTNWLYDDEGELDRFTLIGAITVVLGLLTVLVFLIADRGAAPPLRDYTVRDLPSVEPELQAALDVGRAAQVVQQFLHADGYINKLRYLKDRETVTPLVREYYQRHSDGPILDAIPVESMEGASHFSLSFEIPSLNATCFFNAVQVGGGYEIDWFTTTLYQADHLERFRASKTVEPTTLHLMIQRADYYNYQWSDKSKYVCFELSFPGLETSLYGYLSREDPLAIDLQLMTVLQPSHAAVLEMRYPAPANDPRQVEILRLISRDWLPQP